MKYVVIGGAGAMGRIAVRDLFEFAESRDENVAVSPGDLLDFGGNMEIALGGGSEPSPKFGGRGTRLVWEPAQEGG